MKLSGGRGRGSIRAEWFEWNADDANLYVYFDYDDDETFILDLYFVGDTHTHTPCPWANKSA